MPLNYLGLTVEFHDIRKGLPEISGRDDLRGILMWLTSQQVDDPAAVWAWLDAAAGRGLRLGILGDLPLRDRSEEHTSELQSLMRISYAVFCLKQKIINTNTTIQISLHYVINLTTLTIT